MTPDLPPPPSFWTTLRLLLAAARRRSRGRNARTQALLNQKSGKADASNWSFLGTVFSVFFMVAINVAAAFLVDSSISAAQRFNLQHAGKIVVRQSFLDEVNASATPGGESPDFHSEARSISDKYGGTRDENEQLLRNEVQQHGTRNLVTRDAATPGVEALPRTGRLPAMVGSLILVVWLLMLVFQGEGLELDLQRRRHPMWEWIFSHPVQPGPVFLAEMLGPLAANPIYWAAPAFAGFLYGFVYGPLLGLLATFLVGVPLSFACACLGKALEIGTVLRFPPRTRGAIVGLMGWLGYASMMLMFLGLFILPKIITALGRILTLFTVLPWPWLRLFLGGNLHGGWSFTSGVLTCAAGSVAVLAGAVWFSAWATEQGLSGNFAAQAPAGARPAKAARFGSEPLYRKEFLWFIRDRSAILQTILIPLTVAGVQLFNLRGLIAEAQSAWNYLAGSAIIFGTYFLWVLGPKSLASEGAALWISLTWPRGLEDLLKAKAWLWSLVSTGIVSLALCYGLILFPVEAWKIVLVGIAWFLFSRSMAEKSVTLVTVTSESGDVQPIPKGRRWAAQLGMLTFAIGVFTQQCHLAVMGIVYSYLTAAAMWEQFRARLPFLYDPWSETLPPPPTLMHAMISISILVELGAVLTGILSAALGRDNIGIALAMSYGICAVIVCVGTTRFLEGRGVLPRQVWNWISQTPTALRPELASVVPRSGAALALSRAPASYVIPLSGGLRSQEYPLVDDLDTDPAPFWQAFGLADLKLYSGLAAGACGGIVLGLFARGYSLLLAHLPWTSEIIRKAQQQMAESPNLKFSYFITAVFFAPFAEEYLFRGLLFRALDREWGGWRAVLGAASFFAIYHGPLSWVPVGLVGAANCVLFKKTGRLAPAVILHMVYNAVVLR